ncbi:MAG: hypothetical protein M0R22_11265 [Dehalococcoidia bacterium]|nr:hypothetical protein [Dehalococcoidia bacterium]
MRGIYNREIQQLPRRFISDVAPINQIIPGTPYTCIEPVVEVGLSIADQLWSGYCQHYKLPLAVTAAESPRNVWARTAGRWTGIAVFNSVAAVAFAYCARWTYGRYGGLVRIIVDPGVRDRGTIIAYLLRLIVARPAAQSAVVGVLADGDRSLVHALIGLGLEPDSRACEYFRVEGPGITLQLGPKVDTAWRAAEETGRPNVGVATVWPRSCLYESSVRLINPMAPEARAETDLPIPPIVTTFASRLWEPVFGFELARTRLDGRGGVYVFSDTGDTAFVLYARPLYWLAGKTVATVSVLRHGSPEKWTLWLALHVLALVMPTADFLVCGRNITVPGSTPCATEYVYTVL